jgi:hypothetical protein
MPPYSGGIFLSSTFAHKTAVAFCIKAVTLANQNGSDQVILRSSVWFSTMPSFKD